MGLASRPVAILAAEAPSFRPGGQPPVKKTFVLDTNVLIHNPHALESFEDNTVVIPLGVIEELDTFKKYEDERGRNAREVARMLDDLRKKGKLQEGVPLPNGGVLRVDISTPNGHLPAALSHMK